MAYTFDDLQASYKAKVKEEIPTAKVSDTSFWLKVGNPFIYVLLEYFEFLEQVLRANRYNQATGIDLDNLALNIGMTRKNAVEANGFLLFDGTNGSTIPVNSKAQTVTNTDEDIIQYETTSADTLVHYTASTIAFVDSNPDTITDSANGFVTAGFMAGDYIYITGGNNDGDTFQIDTVVAGTITLVSTDAVTAEIAGTSIKITKLITAEATQGGTSQNVGANTLTVIPYSIAGITSVTNPYEINNGTSAEADGDLYYPWISDNDLVDGETNKIDTSTFRGRIMFKLLNNTGPTTKAGYESSALEVDGVATAVAYNFITNPPEIFISITSNSGNGIPSAILIAEVQAYMEDDSRKDPLNTITILGATPITVNVTYTVTALTGYDTTELQATIEANFDTFFLSLEQAEDVLIERLDNVVHDTLGVYDFVRSAPASNTTINTGEKAVAGTYTITVT